MRRLALLVCLITLCPLCWAEDESSPKSSFLQTEAESTSEAIGIGAIAVSLGLKYATVEATSAVRHGKLKQLCDMADPIINQWRGYRYEVFPRFVEYKNEYNDEVVKEVSRALQESFGNMCDECLCWRWDLVVYLDVVCRGGLDDETLLKFFEKTKKGFAKKVGVAAAELAGGPVAGFLAGLAAKGHSMFSAVTGLMTANDPIADEYLGLVSAAMCEVACGCDGDLMAVGVTHDTYPASVEGWRELCGKVSFHYFGCWSPALQQGQTIIDTWQDYRRGNRRSRSDSRIETVERDGSTGENDIGALDGMSVSDHQHFYRLCKRDGTGVFSAKVLQVGKKPKMDEELVHDLLSPQYGTPLGPGSSDGVGYSGHRDGQVPSAHYGSDWSSDGVGYHGHHDGQVPSAHYGSDWFSEGVGYHGHQGKYGGDHSGYHDGGYGYSSGGFPREY